MAGDDFAYLSAGELIGGYSSGAISPVEVSEAMLARIDRLNPQLNAFTDFTGDIARAAAKKAEADYRAGAAGPLSGVPVTIKDITFIEGLRCRRGSKIYADDAPASFSSPFVQRVLDAGAVLLGQTTTPELGWKGETTSPVSGTTRNPWNLERTPGGSSGGAGACIAAGIGTMAHGTDGAGSIRIPSGFSGIFGLKPSIGLVPVFPASGVADLAYHGPMTWWVRDAALMLNVVAGADPRDRTSWDSNVDYVDALADLDLRGLRVAWSQDLGYAAIEPEIAALAENAAKVFADLGAEVVDDHPNLPDPWPIEHVLWVAAMAGGRRDDFDQVRDIMDPGLADLVEQGQKFTAADVARARTDQGIYAAAWADWLRDYDLLLTPTLPCPAFPVGENYPATINGRETSYLSWTAFTYPFNLNGLPAATVPCGFASDGLPAGLQIVGRLKDDALVLRAAAAFEQARPWQGTRPPLA
ncbi:MAG TPA: amidase family protein [Thermomicrobiales bacterium]|nr:amidase family protein [Thermomicrobiales bacterium]